MPPEPPRKPTFEPGRVIGGKYRIEGAIGEGGMGLVLAARHVAMNNRVAIKVLVMDEDTDRVDAVSRFQREARAIARIESDHVVRVMDVAALEDGTPYMVMEILEGEDFRRLLYNRGQLPIAEAVGYILQACEGLSEVHAAGVVHRDLKPSNLFLARKANGRKLVKVLDFGISKILARSGEVAMTTTSALMGSPVYMAPEQMRSSRLVDARADVWSLGLILYELLAGATAFGGDTIPEVCVAVMSSDPEPISKFRDDVPQGLQAVLLKCMAKDKEERYPSMAAFARELSRFADEGHRVHAERASAAMKAPRVEVDADSQAEAPTLNSQGGIKVGPPSSSRKDPDTIKSWTGGAKKESKGRRRMIWVGVAALVCGIAATVGSRLAQHGPEATHGSGGAPSVIVNTRAPAAPTATSVAQEIPSVSFDSLPQIPGQVASAQTPHPATPPAPPRPPVVKSPSASPPPPPAASVSAPPAAKKEDWKWGDRN